MSLDYKKPTKLLLNLVHNGIYNLHVPDTVRALITFLHPGSISLHKPHIISAMHSTLVGSIEFVTWTQHGR